MMNNALKKLTINDLKIGMHASMWQLSDLYGVWIYINPNTINRDTGEVDILYFCTEKSKDDNKIIDINNKFGGTSVIYQPDFYAEEDAEVYG